MALGIPLAYAGDSRDWQDRHARINGSAVIAVRLLVELDGCTAELYRARCTRCDWELDVVADSLYGRSPMGDYWYDCEAHNRDHEIGCDDCGELLFDAAGNDVRRYDLGCTLSRCELAATEVT